MGRSTGFHLATAPLLSYVELTPGEPRQTRLAPPCFRGVGSPSKRVFNWREANLQQSPSACSAQARPCLSRSQRHSRSLSGTLSRSKPKEKPSLAKFPSLGSYKDHILRCLKWEQTQNILQVLRMKQIWLRKVLRFLVQFPPSKAGEASGIPWCQDPTRPSQMPRFVLSSLCQQPTPQLNR